MARRLSWVVTATFLLLASVTVVPLKAQNATGTVLGHIQDPSGGAVPNAKVTLLNEATGVSTVFTTSTPGDYVFVKHIPGTYDVTVEAQGFKMATTKGLVLHVDQTLRQDFTLEVGAVSQQVTVTATAAMLQSDSTTIGELVGERTIDALPLNGRDYITLIGINAGVTQPSGGINTGIFDPHGLDTNAQMSSINGARPASVAFMVDGITDNEIVFDKAISLISADAIQEFKLQNGMYSSEYGTGAGQVNIAIKSGTNMLHGSAYDYMRNEAFQPASEITAALNALQNKHTPVAGEFIQNQFGFTLGGPMVLPKIYNGRNKTFWFVAYEGGREISAGTGPASANVPTDLERGGNFSEWPYPIYDPSTTGSVAPTATDPTGRTQFTGNIIPPGDISPISTKWLNYFPAPNTTCAPVAQCANYYQVLKSTITTDTVNGRVDHIISDRDRISGTVVVSRDVPYSPSLLPASGSVSFARTRMVSAEYDHNFSPNSINTFRVGYNRELFHEGSVTSFGPNLSALLGFANTTTSPAFYGLPQAAIDDGYSSPGNNNNGYTQTDNIFQWVDNYTLIHGKHTFTIGADIRRDRVLDEDGFSVNGVTAFTGAYTASNPATAGSPGPNNGNGFADFLLGYPYSIGAPVPVASDLFDVRATDWNFFFQDDWRITPRLTLNLGIRYEYPESFHTPANDGAQLNEATPGGGAIWASKAFTAPLQSIPEANIYYQCCVTNEMVPTDRRDWAPRIGFAWRPLPKNDKLVLRAGYGIFFNTYMRFYDGEDYNADILSLLSPAIYPSATGLESASPLATKTLWLPPVAVSPATFTPPPPFNNYLDYEGQTEWAHNRTPYDQQWTLDAQYAFTNNLMLDVAYVGSRGLREPTQWFINTAYPPTVAGDPCNSVLDRSLASAACLSDPNFQPVDTRTTNYSNFTAGLYVNSNNLFSNYHALQVRLNKRFTQGLQFGFNYTYSRSFDEQSEIAAFSGQNNLLQNGNDPRGDYGPAAFDVPQRLSVNYLYDVPVGKGRKWSLGKANWLLGGWQTSGILTFSTGEPFTVFCCPRSTAVNQMGAIFGDTFRPELVGNPHAVTQSDLTWFNASAYATPELGRYGDVTRDSLYTPGFHGGDVSFKKNFAITERHVIRYQLDIFNVFSSRHDTFRFPDSRESDSPSPCTVGVLGTCHFGSLVSLNGLGDLNLWSPRVIQMSLRYVF
jgi:hypothetical protein